MSSRLERLLGMEHLIRKGAYPNVETLCQMFDVRPRSIYQDLRMLRQEAGLSIAFDRARNGYYIENPEKTLPAFELTQEELLSLALSMELFSGLTQQAFEPVLAGALDKIIERNKSKPELTLCGVQPFIRVIGMPAEAPARKVIIELFKACRQRRIVSIRYFAGADKREVSGTVQPRCLLFRGGAWHLIAFCQQIRVLRALPLECISSVVNSRQSGPAEDDHDIDAFVRAFFAPQNHFRPK